MAARHSDQRPALPRAGCCVASVVPVTASTARCSGLPVLGEEDRPAMTVDFEKLHSFCCPDAGPASAALTRLY
jgi:hypothetical protein